MPYDRPTPTAATRTNWPPELLYSKYWLRRSCSKSSHQIQPGWGLAYSVAGGGGGGGGGSGPVVSCCDAHPTTMTVRATLRYPRPRRCTSRDHAGELPSRKSLTSPR